LKVDRTKALLPSAFTIDKTLIYYSKDQNNIAENGYPLDVFGIEQNFNFPSVYFARKKSNQIELRIDEAGFERQKRILSKMVSQAFLEIVYLQNRQKFFLLIDSLYANFYKDSELKYKHGDISYLESLNSKAKKSQISLQINQINSDLEIAGQKLKSLMQYDSAYSIKYYDLYQLTIDKEKSETEPGLEIMNLNVELQTSNLKLEKNKYLPDINLGIFNGSNSQVNAVNYIGYQIGIGIPIFFGEQRAKVQSEKIGLSMAEYMLENYQRSISGKKESLYRELEKYKQFIDAYQEINAQLSDEILKSAQKSFQFGEIDFYKYTQSVENAILIKLDYLENLNKYNYILLEIKYLTN
jgi:cobalt-zinc-cadmium resistance protein CzcA